jgi:hypothetical protein
MSNTNNKIVEYALTFDVDWVPDYAINFVIDQLIKNNIHSIWFITHSSPAIERLKEYPNGSKIISPINSDYIKLITQI